MGSAGRHDRPGQADHSTVIGTLETGSRPTGHAPASCALVLLWRSLASEAIMYDKILVPVDGSQPSALGLLEAIKLAQGQRCKLRLLNIVCYADIALAEAAYPSDELRKRLRQEGEAALKEATSTVRENNLQFEAVLRETSISNTGDLIVNEAKEWPADLIVMGTHGRRGLVRLILGSSAEFVVHHSWVPVLLVRSHPTK